MAEWNRVRSRDEAEVLRRDGQLEPILLMPAELGGVDDPRNVVLVPPAARAQRDAAVAELLETFRAGEADRLSVTPEYRGDSFVPCALAIGAWREGSRPAYERRIEIW